MGNVRGISSEIHEQIELMRVDPQNAATGDGGGGGTTMEARVQRLEADMQTIKVDLGVIKATMATKADLAGLRSEIRSEIANLGTSIQRDMHAQTTKFIQWMLGAVGLITVLVAAVSWIGGVLMKLPT